MNKINKHMIFLPFKVQKPHGQAKKQSKVPPVTVTDRSPHQCQRLQYLPRMRQITHFTA